MSQFSMNTSVYQLYIFMIYRYCKSIKIFEYLWIYLQFMKLGLQSKTNNHSKCCILCCSFSNSIATVYYCIIYSKDQKRKIWNKVSLYNFSQKKFWNWIYRIYGSSCSFEFIHLWLNLSSFLHRYLFRALYRMA